MAPKTSTFFDLKTCLGKSYRHSEYGYFQGKGKKGKKGKGKGKKGHGPSEQGKGQGDGKGEANYVNPSHSSQPAVQQAALPSSASASGFFVTHSDVSLTSVKVTPDEDQSMEPDLSGCAFLGQEANPVQKVEEEGVAFHFFSCIAVLVRDIVGQQLE